MCIYRWLMRVVRLTGQLRCKDLEETRLVVDHLPEHVALTRAEPGCVSFHVARTLDPLVWHVDECFEDEAAFRAHQARVATSDWGRRTAGIERRYSIQGMSG
jgi:quinol monooxygenase YgiN